MARTQAQLAARAKVVARRNERTDDGGKIRNAAGALVDPAVTARDKARRSEGPQSKNSRRQAKAAEATDHLPDTDPRKVQPINPLRVKRYRGPGDPRTR